MSQYRHAGEHDNDEEGPTFYAGGAEGGGGELLVGPRRPGPPDDLQPLTRDQLSNTLFRAGRADRAREDRVEAEAHRHPYVQLVVFTGSGNRLGSTTDIQRLRPAPLLPPVADSPAFSRHSSHPELLPSSI